MILHNLIDRLISGMETILLKLPFRWLFKMIKTHTLSILILFKYYLFLI